MKSKSLYLYKKKPVKQAVTIVGVPFEEGSDAEGLKDAPEYLRTLGLTKDLENAGLIVKDTGNVEILNSKNRDEKSLKQNALLMAEKVADIVSREISLGHRVIAIGGDHGISLGTIAGASVAKGVDIGIIWIDAHPDLSTWDESLTKNIHGMQAAALIGFGDHELVNVVKRGQKIKKQNILYIGLKDMDPHEIRLIEKEKINAITMFDILNGGIGGTLQVLEKFLKKHKNIWVSLDMDGIAKQYVPSSPMATDEGLTSCEVLTLVRFIGRKGNVIGGDVVEFAKKGDVDNKTGRLAIDLIAKLFGTDIGWYERYMLGEK